jgi:Rrf2 family protein
VAEIAERTRVPPLQLAKVIQSLARAGLVVTTRGRGGGVRLARPAEEIRLLDVIEAFQGPLRLFRCRLQGNGCPRNPDCAIYRLWGTLNDGLGTLLERVHISELLQTCEGGRWTGPRPPESTRPSETAF